MALKTQVSSEQEREKALATVTATCELFYPKKEENSSKSYVEGGSYIYPHLSFYIPIRSKAEPGYLAQYLKTPTSNIKKALTENTEKNINSISKDGNTDVCTVSITFLEKESHEDLDTDLLIVRSKEGFDNNIQVNLEYIKMEFLLPRIMEEANKDLANFGREINMKLLIDPLLSKKFIRDTERINSRKPL